MNLDADQILRKMTAQIIRMKHLKICNILTAIALDLVYLETCKFVIITLFFFSFSQLSIKLTAKFH